MAPSLLLNNHDQRFVPRGIAHMSLAVASAPITVSFVLLRRFTMLAFASAIEPLRVANQLVGNALFRWNVYSEDGTPVSCSNGLLLQTDGPLPRMAPEGYVLVCSGLDPDSACSPDLADWIRFQWRHGRTVGGICTGAQVLARAGILKDRAFTIHWENRASFQEQFPDLEPQEQIYCQDDRIITCAGGAAASDLALHLIHAHFGATLSQSVMNMCLQTRQREATDAQIPSQASQIGSRNVHLLKAIAFLQDNLEEQVSARDCAESAGVSTRQIERLFRTNLRTTPCRYLLDLRLQHGRELLSTTDLGVTEIAVACGFLSSSHFSKTFAKKYGISPHRFTHFRENDSLAANLTARAIGAAVLGKSQNLSN